VDKQGTNFAQICFTFQSSLRIQHIPHDRPTCQVINYQSSLMFCNFQVFPRLNHKKHLTSVLPMTLPLKVVVSIQRVSIAVLASFTAIKKLWIALNTHNRHLLRSNVEDYGCKNYTDSKHSNTLAPSGRKL